MLADSLGAFDHVVGMDSLIHYRRAGHGAPSPGSPRASASVLFTFAPRTPMLSVMHAVGRLFPRSDRAPAIEPVRRVELMRRLSTDPALAGWRDRPARGASPPASTSRKRWSWCAHETGVLGANGRIVRQWSKMGPRFLPFADARTTELPLGRLLRLSLFQVSVGMAVVLLIGTLNRVMIVELGVPAWLVAVMVALPLVFARSARWSASSPTRTARCSGWKRVPYIWFGTLLQFGGLAIMPFALILLSGDTSARRSSGRRPRRSRS